MQISSRRINRTSEERIEMGLQFASCVVLLFHLLLVMCAQGSESRQMRNQDSNNIIIQLPSSNTIDANHHQSSHMDHMDPSAMRFFTIEDMYVGKRLPLYFHRTESSSNPPPQFLPRYEADSIPFSSEHLSNILGRFSIPPGSPQAQYMASTLRQCEMEPMEGETNMCATSLESMLDYNRGVFGQDTPFRVLTTTYFSDTGVSFQNYTILEEPKQVLASKMVACHSLPYPYAVFYCHSQRSENRVFVVLIGGDNGEVMEAVAVCHMDTSQWSPQHSSFRVLGIRPGTSPVCHFFYANNLIWVPSSASLH